MKHKIWLAALAAVVLSLTMASSAMAATQVADDFVTAAPNSTATVDIFANDPDYNPDYFGPGSPNLVIMSTSCNSLGGGLVSYTAGPNADDANSCISVVFNQANGDQLVETFTVTTESSGDSESPVVTVTSPVDGSPVSTSTVTVNYTYTDNVGVTGCSPAYGTVVTLVQGDNPITVTCQDAANNVGSQTVHVNYQPPDTTAPVVTITAPANGTIFTVNTANLTFGVTDDQDPIPTCDRMSGDDVPLPIVGSNTIAVNCTDAAGNVGSASVTVTYTPPVDPDRVKIRLGNLKVREGDTNKTAYVPITLSRAYPVPITLSYSTQQGQGRERATSGVDYVAVTNELVTIPANQTEWELPVTIIGDNLKESSENFFVIGDLTIESDAFAILVKDKATVVITNDDKSGCNDGFNHGHGGHDDNHDGRDDAHE